MARLLKGAPAAKALTERLIPQVEELKARGVVPTLAILRAGERPGDVAYENAAVKRCGKAGVAARRVTLPADCTRREILDAVDRINRDPAVHGCLLLRPLPDRETEQAVAALLDPRKDVDGMTAASLAGVFAGSGAGFPPCTAQACLEILDYYGIPLEGQRAAVIGRSLVIGKPAAMLLQARNATVTMCHTKTVDLPAVCRNAGLIVAAAGRAELVTGEFLSPGQVVLDVGVNEGPGGELLGDVKLSEAEGIVSAVTPVPGGVGAVTTAVLCAHVVRAARLLSEGAEA